MENPLADYDHPAWHTAVATGLGYGVILVTILVALFVIPFLIFTAL